MLFWKMILGKGFAPIISWFCGLGLSSDLRLNPSICPWNGGRSTARPMQCSSPLPLQFISVVITHRLHMALPVLQCDQELIPMALGEAGTMGTSHPWEQSHVERSPVKSLFVIGQYRYVFCGSQCTKVYFSQITQHAHICLYQALRWPRKQLRGI